MDGLEGCGDGCWGVVEGFGDFVGDALSDALDVGAEAHGVALDGGVAHFAEEGGYDGVLLCKVVDCHSRIIPILCFILQRYENSSELRVQSSEFFLRVGVRGYQQGDDEVESGRGGSE